MWIRNKRSRCFFWRISRGWVFFFLSKLGTKKDKSQLEGEGLAHWGSQQELSAALECGFLWIFNSESAGFSVGLMGRRGSCCCLKGKQIHPVRAALCSSGSSFQLISLKLRAKLDRELRGQSGPILLSPTRDQQILSSPDGSRGFWKPWNHPSAVTPPTWSFHIICELGDKTGDSCFSPWVSLNLKNSVETRPRSPELSWKCFTFRDANPGLILVYHCSVGQTLEAGQQLPGKSALPGHPLGGY